MKKNYLKLSVFSLSAFILSANLNTAKAQVNFAPAVNYGTDLSHEFVISADFNGDGKKDLAVTRTVVGGGISILIGNGDGTFASYVSYSVGAYPYSISSQDFDGDGDMDLVTANWAANNVSVLKNNGNGTFATAVNYGVSGGPISVCSADFDGDGDYDFAVSRNTSNNVSVFFNNGSGVFSLNNSYTIGNTPEYIITSDVDGDSDKDLVTANGSNDNISVLINNGSGSFGLANNYSVGSSPQSVFSTDFNGDGKIDLATANSSSNNVSVLLGSGTGTFAAAVNYGVGTNPNSIFSADFNGDGSKDLVTANSGSNDVSVLLGNGTGTFATAVNYGVGSGPTCVFSSDFNADGRMDIAASNSSSNNVSVLLNLPPAGAALNFDGADDYINVLNNSSFDFGTNDFTIETWAKTTSTSGVQVMIGKFDASNNYWLGVNNGKVTFSMIGGSNMNGTTSIANGNWHHIAVVKQNGGLSLYIDGTLDASGANAGTATISGNLTLGNFNGGYNFPGSLDEVRIWNRALCKGELLNNKNAELPSSQTGLVAYYNFNQGISATNNSTVTTLNDLSGNANNGTLNHFALSGTTSNWIVPGAVTSGSAAPTYTPVSASVSSQTNVLCNGGNTGSATVVTTGGTSPYTYLASTGATVSTLSNLTAGAYTYTVTDNNGCAKTQALTITEPGILGTALGIWAVSCNGLNNGQLIISGTQGTAPYTYAWSTGATTSTITNLPPGVYTATVTDANGCVAIRTKTITEPPPITVTITASNSNICSGSSSTLTASASGGLMGSIYTYSWVAGPTASVSVVSPTSTTVYTVNVTDDNSCVQTATVSVTANVCTPAEALNFDGTNDYISLPTNPVSGDFTIEYWVKTTQTGGGPQWYGGIGIVDAEYPGVTNDFGTALVGNKFAFGIGNPDATIVSTTSINDGTWHHVAGTWVMSTGAMSLYVDGVLESTGVGSTNPRNTPTRITIGCMQTLFTYFNGEIDEVRIWNNARTQCEINTYKNCEIPANATGLVANYHFNQGNAAVNNAGLTSLTDATSNNMTGSLTNFALNGATSNWVAPGGVVSGNTTPALTPTVTVNSGAICAGESFTLMPMGADTYTFSNGSDVVMPTSDATYTVSGTVAATGCSNTAVSSVTVNPLPIVFSNPGNVHTCGDVSATFGVSSAGTNTYQWYFEYTQLPNDSDLIDGSYTEINFDTDTMTIQQVLTGNYNNYYVYCEVTNQYGCKAYSTNDTIWANPSPTVTINSGTICAGQSFTMIPSGASTYSYSNGSNVAMPTVNATYTVTGTDLNGCENTAVSTVTVNTLPSIMAATNNTLLCTGQTATLSVMGANTYTWSTTENTSDIVVSPTVQTTYTVTGKNVYGCENRTTVTLNVSTCTEIKSLSSDEMMSIYPNPNNGLFIIELTAVSKVAVMNSLGQVIISETFEAGKHTVNINNESPGVYFVKVITNSKQQMIKIIKE